ncbi:MAG: hypothetical protein ACO1SV_05975 [Fimbriimonas sp.]
MGQVVRLPAPAILSVGASERWSIRPVREARKEREVDHRSPHRVKLAGKTVTISPNPNWAIIDGIEKGSDNSLLIHRASREIRWESQDSIWYRGRETVVPGHVSHYRDRMNYAGSIIRESNAMGMPESAPEGLVVENGRRRELGFGGIRDWRGTTFVLSVPVDGKGNPSGTEFTEGVVTRIVEGPKATIYPGFVFLGREADGTIVLTTGSAGRQEGFVPMNQGPPPKPAVLRVRGGKVLSYWEMPPGWRVTGLAKSGWILLRQAPVEKPLEMSEIKPGMKMDEVSKQMDALMKSQTEALTREERDWTAGILYRGAITPLRFDRPPKTNHLLWRDGYERLGVDAFRLTAFYGGDQRTFRVAAPKTSAIR